MIRIRLKAILAVTAVVGSAAISTEAANKTWNNSAGGDWSDSKNWDGGVPGATDNAVITLAGEYTVTLSNTVTIAGLTTHEDLTLRIVDSTLTVKSSFTNRGTIDLTTNSKSVAGVASNASIINAAGAQLIASAGQKSGNRRVGGRFVNDGLLQVELRAGESLQFDTATAPFLNSGRIQLDSGTILILKTTGQLTSFAGALEIARGATVRVEGGELEMLDVESTGDGLLDVVDAATTLSDALVEPLPRAAFGHCTISGEGRLINARGLLLARTTVNVDIQNEADLEITGESVINGQLSDVPSGCVLRLPAIRHGSSSARFARGFTNTGTIELGGEIDDSLGVELSILEGALVNSQSGVIHASCSAERTFLLSGALENDGLLLVDGAVGGRLALGSRAPIANFGRVLIESAGLHVNSDDFLAGGGSLVELRSGASLVQQGKLYRHEGGSIRGFGSALLATEAIELAGDLLVDASSWTLEATAVKGSGALINAGAMTLRNARIYVPLDNRGDLDVRGSSFAIGGFTGVPAARTLQIVSKGGEARFSTKFAFTNYGRIRLTNADDTGAWRSTLVVEQGTLTNARGGQILAERGTKGGTRHIEGAVDNAGVIELSEGLDGLYLKETGANAFVNTGDIRIRGGQLNFQKREPPDPPFVSSGSIEVAPGCVLAIDGPHLELAGGELVLDRAELRLFSNAKLKIRGGVLSALGKITGEVENTEGRVRLTDRIGKLQITENFVQGAAGTLEVKIGGSKRESEYDWLAVSKRITLDGRVVGRFVNNYVPASGMRFDIGSCGSRAGTFDEVRPVDLDFARELFASQTSTRISLETRERAQFRAEISSPGYGTETREFESLEFAAQQIDGLDPVAYQWTSDRDGPIGDAVSFTTTALSPGVHHITLAVTDDSGATAFDEVRVRVLPIPDLVIATVGGPVLAFVHEPFDISWSLKNEGRSVAGGPWVNMVALSNDVQLDGSDPQLQLVPDSDDLNPGESRSGLCSAIAWGVAPGEWFIIVQADAWANVSEPSAEDNNSRASALPVRFVERGDCNCSGTVDIADIDGFVAALIDPALYSLQYPNCGIATADCDRNGSVEFDDIDIFVRKMMR